MFSCAVLPQFKELCYAAWVQSLFISIRTSISISANGSFQIHRSLYRMCSTCYWALHCGNARHTVCSKNTLSFYIYTPTYAARIHSLAAGVRSGVQGKYIHFVRIHTHMLFCWHTHTHTQTYSRVDAHTHMLYNQHTQIHTVQFFFLAQVLVAARPSN